MKCQISVSYIPIEEGIRKQKLNDDSDFLELCSILHVLSLHNTCKQQGNGFIFNFNNENYILTCEHIISTSLKDDHKYEVIISEKENLIAELEFIIPYIDIAILKLSGISDNIGLNLNEYMIHDVKRDENDYLPELDIYINSFEKNIKVLKHEKTYNYLKSLLFPQVPIINIKIDRKEDYHGLSGSIIQTDDIYIGMIICTTNDIIECISLPFILTLINNMLMRKIYTINTIFIKSNECNITYKDGELWAHYVNELTCSYLNKSKDFRFKVGDVILNINDNYFDKNGYIFCEQLCTYIPMNLYILLFFTLNENITMSVVKTNKVNSMSKTYVLNYKKLEDIFSINLYDTKLRLRWKNYIFCELSEEYVKKKLKYSSTKLLSIIDLYSLYNNKIIILEDVYDSDESTLEPTDKLGNIKILDKVSKNKIYNLSNLYDILRNDKNQHTFTFITTDLEKTIIKKIL